MKQFTIVFYFDGQFYAADVTEIGGLDDTQYAISQQDEKLAERFKTNIIRESKDDHEFQYALPDDPSGVEFMEAMVKGLQKAIHK